MKNIKYHDPATLDAALDLLVEFSGRCHVFSGGTDYVVELNEKRRIPAENIIYLGRIAEMKFIRQNDSTLEIGSGITHAELESDQAIRRFTPLLATAAGMVGCPAIRSMGTIGGNIGTASPAGDVSTALLALDSRVVVKSRGESRKIHLRDFFTGPGKTLLKPKELIYSVVIPLPEVESTGQTFMKLGKRQAMSCAIISCATVATIDQRSKTMADVKIGLGSVAPKPIRAAETEKFLKGKPLTEATLEKSAQVAMDECRPIDDIRGSAAYRRDMVGVFVKRSLRETCRQALNAA